MNQEITFPCAALPTAVESSLTVAGAMERFDAEAEAGVCDTGRYLCRYVVWGEGPPLVFVHGLCDAARSFVMPMAALSRSFRCIAYDLPTGRDDGARIARYRHADYVDDLFHLLDHLGLEQTDLYGSSFGSTIVLQALYDAPERFGHAVIQGGFARRRLAPAEALLARVARWWRWPMGRLPGRSALLRHSHYHAFVDCQPTAWDYYLERANDPPMAAVARRALIVHSIDLRHLLPRIHHPVLLICGSGDPLVDRACENDLLHGLSGATRAEIDGCGHYPYFSHPEIMAELILRFLTPLPCQLGC